MLNVKTKHNMEWIAKNKSVVVFSVAMIVGFAVLSYMDKKKVESGYCGCGK